MQLGYAKLAYITKLYVKNKRQDVLHSEFSFSTNFSLANVQHNKFIFCLSKLQPYEIQFIF